METHDGDNEDRKITIEDILHQRGIPNQILKAIEGTQISLSIERGELHLVFKTPVVMVSLFILVTLAWGNIDVAVIMGYLSRFLAR
jgi:hypothetical protein